LFFHGDVLLVVGGLVRVATPPLLFGLRCVRIPFLTRLLWLDGIDLLGKDGDLLLDPGCHVGSFIVLDEL